MGKRPEAQNVDVSVSEEGGVPRRSILGIIGRDSVAHARASGDGNQTATDEAPNDQAPPKRHPYGGGRSTAYHAGRRTREEKAEGSA